MPKRLDPRAKSSTAERRRGMFPRMAVSPFFASGSGTVSTETISLIETGKEWEGERDCKLNAKQVFQQNLHETKRQHRARQF